MCSGGKGCRLQLGKCQWSTSDVDGHMQQPMPVVDDSDSAIGRSGGMSKSGGRSKFVDDG